MCNIMKMVIDYFFIMTDATTFSKYVSKIFEHNAGKHVIFKEIWISFITDYYCIGPKTLNEKIALEKQMAHIVGEQSM